MTHRTFIDVTKILLLDTNIVDMAKCYFNIYKIDNRFVLVLSES